MAGTKRQKVISNADKVAGEVLLIYEHAAAAKRISN